MAQGIAFAADHLLVEFLLGGMRCEASLAEGSADHQLVEFVMLCLCVTSFRKMCAPQIKNCVTGHVLVNGLVYIAVVAITIILLG